MQGAGIPPNGAASTASLAVIGDSRPSPPTFADPLALADILPPPSPNYPADGRLSLRAPTAAEILKRPTTPLRSGAERQCDEERKP